MYSFETRMKALSIADVFATPRMTRSTFETTLTSEPTSQSNTHRSVWWAAQQPKASLPTRTDNRRRRSAERAAETESASDSDRVRTPAPAAVQMAGSWMEVRVYRDSYATPWGFPYSVKRVRAFHVLYSAQLAHPPTRAIVHRCRLHTFASNFIFY